MEIQKFNQLVSQLLREKEVLTVELYNLFSIDQRREIFKQWLISEGLKPASASAYINFYPRY